MFLSIFDHPQGDIFFFLLQLLKKKLSLVTEVKKKNISLRMVKD